MGKQTGLYVEGKAGNILYYSWKGIPCERMIPALEPYRRMYTRRRW